MHFPYLVTSPSATYIGNHTLVILITSFCSVHVVTHIIIVTVIHTEYCALNHVPECFVTVLT